MTNDVIVSICCQCLKTRHEFWQAGGKLMFLEVLVMQQFSGGKKVRQGRGGNTVSLWQWNNVPEVLTRTCLVTFWNKAHWINYLINAWKLWNWFAKKLQNLSYKWLKSSLPKHLLILSQPYKDDLALCLRIIAHRSRLERIQRRATTKMIKGLESCPVRQGWESWVWTPLRKEGLSLCPSIQGWLQMKTAFLPIVMWKRRRLMGTSYSMGDSDWTGGKGCSQWKQSAIGISNTGYK